jgi:hypothetical protein
MKAQLALFTGHGSGTEMRLYFPTWEVDGRTLKGVNLLPHRCDPSVCEYGDHVHVGVYDDPVEILDGDVALSDDQAHCVTSYLRAQLAVDRLVDDFENLITTATAVHSG